MIVEWFIGLWTGFVGWLMSLFPASDASGLTDMVNGSQSLFTQLSAGISGLSGWIPWTVLGVTLGVLVTLWLVTLGIRVVKALIPFISG